MYSANFTFAVEEAASSLKFNNADSKSLEGASSSFALNYTASANSHLFTPSSFNVHGPNIFPKPSDAAGIRNVVPILTPTYGKHRSHVDAIFVFAAEYSLPIYLTFVKSLRKTGFAGDIVFAVSTLDLKADNVQNFLKNEEGKTWFRENGRICPSAQTQSYVLFSSPNIRRPCPYTNTCCFSTQALSRTPFNSPVSMPNGKRLTQLREACESVNFTICGAEKMPCKLSPFPILAKLVRLPPRDMNSIGFGPSSTSHMLGSCCWMQEIVIFRPIHLPRCLEQVGSMRTEKMENYTSLG